MSSTTYGKRVVGEKEHADAVAAQAGGSNVFGKRVRGALNANNPAETEKAASEFGVRTVGGASQSNTKGESSTISVEELKVLLDQDLGNIAMFDSLYENELGLEGGPRKAALEIFLQAELGKKGAAREFVKNQIRSLLGYDSEAAKRAADDVGRRQEQLHQQQVRAEENKSLRDLPRLRALQEREKAVGELHSAKSEAVRGQMLSLTEEGQRKQMEEKSEGGDKEKGEGSKSEESTSKTEKPKSGGPAARKRK